MWLFLLIILFAAWCATVDGTSKSMSKKGFIYSFVFLAFFVGMGDMLGGYDRYIYGELFDSIAYQIKNGNLNLQDTTLASLYGQEMGYVYSNIFIAHITKNRYIFILIFTLVFFYNICRNLLKYTEHYSWALLFFLAFWFFFSFTYLRQVMAVSIAWYSIRYIESRDWKRFFAVIFLAYLFHNSAIMFIPMYFVPIQKFEKRKIGAIAVIAFAISFMGFAQVLFDSYAEHNEARANVTTYAADTGGRWAYLVESIVLIYLIFSKYDTLFANKRMTLMTNMSLAFCFILLAFFRSENGGRLSWYYMIGVISTFSVIGHTCSVNMKRGLILLCLGLYMRVLIGWGGIGILYPYTTFLSGEPRTWDAGWRGWEYDHNYDYNKLYKW